MHACGMIDCGVGVFLSPLSLSVVLSVRYETGQFIRWIRIPYFVSLSLSLSLSPSPPK